MSSINCPEDPRPAMLMPALDSLSDASADPRSDATRRAFLRAAASAALLFGGLPARAAGGGGVVYGFPLRQSTQDLVMGLLRDLQPRYQPTLGARPVYVPGQGGASAMLAVADAPPDGASVLLTSSSSVTLLPLLKKLPLDPATKLRPVVGIGEVCYAFVVGPAVPPEIRTMPDYLRWAQVNPGGAQYGIPGRGTSPHFIGLEVVRLSEVPLKSIGYQGVQPILQDVATGSMPAAVTLLPSGSDPANYPTLRILAVSCGQRWLSIPSVPTLLELGLAESPTVDSFGFFTSARTPDAKVAELRDAMSVVLRAPQTIAAMDAIGLEPLSGEIDYPAQIAAERAEWQSRVERRHFSVES